MEVSNKYITIKTQIERAPKETDFELKTAAITLSIEPGSNDAIDAFGVAKVVVSGNPEFQKDELVVGSISWGEYKLVKGGDRFRKLDPMGFPLSYHAGMLGYSGLAAYSGFFEICKPRKGEKVFVSGASGSVGNLVGQFAKLLGCYLVGSVGNNEKVAILKKKLGFDDAFNYKEEPDYKAALKRYFPDGIDIYFDNVGGEMLEAAVANMNLLGRVAACGAIAEYTDATKRAAPSMLDVVYKRIKIQGFLISDHMNLYADFISMASEHLLNGKIQPLEDISNGVESIPSAFIELFQGDNIGKKIVRIAED
ncbi:2-alkenal reductase (NADP(+)-dependent)-like isoform X2 [Mangifera indica]|uniref:2-alkenal reductase (NADP(+)-dependent)-like isoform X2 n=1 Tax=Mangifera indica TaxID=29780 RepID=UPI001CFA0453|nr:2-alkenal reductase (NADP(+)-dependent)-like isoform X2 [Mangifera indica]